MPERDGGSLPLQGNSPLACGTRKRRSPGLPPAAFLLLQRDYLRTRSRAPPHLHRSPDDVAGGRPPPGDAASEHGGLRGAPPRLPRGGFPSPQAFRPHVLRVGGVVLPAAVCQRGGGGGAVHPEQGLTQAPQPPLHRPGQAVLHVPPRQQRLVPEPRGPGRERQDLRHQVLPGPFQLCG